MVNKYYSNNIVISEEFAIKVPADADFEKDNSGIVNYKDPEIGLKLPVEDIIISDYDKNAN